MKKALVIGCGRIGFLCDYNESPSSVVAAYSHARALYQAGGFELYFYDADFSKAEKAAKYYEGKALRNLDDSSRFTFDIVSIAASTPQHCPLYKRFAGKTKLIILEKPLSNSLAECHEIKEAYENTKQKTFVNFMRNLLPAYARLKKEILKLEEVNPFTEIQMSYHRGLINNGSHALACVSFLLDQTISLEEHTLLSVKKFDEMPDDSSISLFFSDKGREYFLLGLEEKEYPVLDISLYSKTHFVKISNSGNTLQIFRKTSNDIHGVMMEEIFREDRALENFMGKIVTMLTDEKNSGHLVDSLEDNFMESYALNLELLKVCHNSQ